MIHDRYQLMWCAGRFYLFDRTKGKLVDDSWSTREQAEAYLKLELSEQKFEDTVFALTACAAWR